MTHIELIKGTSDSIHITDIAIIQDDGTCYPITYEDKVVFCIYRATNNRGAVITKTFGNGIELVNGELYITLTDEETKELCSIAYTFDCKLDMRGQGKVVIQLVSGVLVVGDS